MPHIQTLARLIPDVFRLAMADAQPFKIDGVYCRILPLTRGLWSIIDADDFEWLNQWKWNAQPHHSGNKYYAGRSERRNGRSVSIKLHQILCSIGADHINLCSIDNRRKNLRPATNAENRANCQPRGTRKYKGVYRKARCRESYESAITANRVRLYLGTFRQAEAAARAYDKAAVKHFGKFARLNFPDEQLRSSTESGIFPMAGVG